MRILIYNSNNNDTHSNHILHNFINKNKRFIPQTCFISNKISPILKCINHPFTHIIQKKELSTANYKLLSFIKQQIDLKSDSFIFCEQNIFEFILMYIHRILKINTSCNISNNNDLFEINDTYNYYKIRTLSLEKLM